jgi:hypothetical protein
MDSERLGVQPGQKAKYWLILKQIMHGPFFLCVRWHVTCKQHFRSICFRAAKSVWSCSATASGSQGAEVGERWHGFWFRTLAPFFQPAGECLVVIVRAICDVKMNSF